MTTNRSFSRRDLLRIVAVGGIAGLTAKMGLEASNAGEIARETRLLMGTVINIMVVSSDLERGQAAARACLDRMEALENILSRFKPQSQLSHLNREGNLAYPHPALKSLLLKSRELSQITSGAFDVSIQPLLDLYRSCPGKLPTSRQIKDVINLVDYRQIELNGDFVALGQPGMSITLDGIAKGLIVDEGVAILKEFGFAAVLVEAGGDILGLGGKAPRSPWKIGIQAPRGEMGNRIATFCLRDQALATSGDYMQAFTADFANHHILDPRTGYASPELASVSILAPTAALADALATAVMALGIAGLDLIEGMPDCEAFVITKDLEVLQTSGIAIG